MEQVTAPLPPEQETPAEAAPEVVPWVPALTPPDHCTGCSVEKTDAPRCEHCGAAIRAGGHVILRTISQGPHGRVYEALAPNGKKVALKELIFSLVPDAATLDAFQREAELLRSVSHAQIPRLLAAFSEGVGVNTRLYLAQELVEGMSLQEAIARAPLSTLEARRLARQILRVLQVLHGRDPPVLHRDIKPANLILQPDGVMSLVDFGSARLLARGVTHGATLVGTFGYMPPEQLGGTVDASCDIYALGATLMHALTGKPPEEMTRDGFSLDVDRHLRDLADPGLKRAIRKMVAPNRADRFRSAEEALYALRGTQPMLPSPWRALSVRARLLLGLAAVASVGLGAVLARVPAREERSVQRHLEYRWSISVSEGQQGRSPLPTGMAGVRIISDRPDALVLLDGLPLSLPAMNGLEPYEIAPGAHEVRFGLSGGRGNWGVGRFGVSPGQVVLVRGTVVVTR